LVTDEGLSNEAARLILDSCNVAETRVRTPSNSADFFNGTAAPTLTEEDEVTIRCALARASQPKDEERALL